MYKFMSICFDPYFHTTVKYINMSENQCPLYPPFPRYRFVQKLTLKLPFSVDANLYRFLIVSLLDIALFVYC